MTTPRRRHKTGFHFSSEVSREVAAELGLRFYEDAFTAENRNRIQPEFHLEQVPDEANVLLLDDVVSEAGKVVFFVAAIRNSN